MMCYRDRTYCSADIDCATHDCDRRMTPEVIRGADRVGLPIATSDFRDTCTKYQPPPGGAGSTGGTTP